MQAKIKRAAVIVLRAQRGKVVVLIEEDSFECVHSMYFTKTKTHSHTLCKSGCSVNLCDIIHSLMCCVNPSGFVIL